MPLNPEALSYGDAKKFIAGRTRLSAFDNTITRLIEEGDYWQRGARYAGPLPTPGPGFFEAMQVLRRSYVPLEKLKECLRRHVRGVVGREPQFELVLPEATERRERAKLTAVTGVDALADEADKLQGKVWDDRGELKIAQQFTSRLRATSQAFFRYDVPPGLLVEGRDRETGEEDVPGIEAKDWQDAYQKLHVELVEPGAATIHLDKGTLQKTAFYSYVDTHDDKPNRKRRCIQISWVDENGITQVRIVRDDKSEDAWEVDTGGHLLLIEARCAPLLSPDLLQLQDVACSGGTMIKFNDDIAGFPQETVIDIEPPTITTPDPNDATKMIKKPAPVARGPRKVQAYYSYQEKDAQGNASTDDKGKPIMRQGRIEYRQPVDSKPLRDNVDWYIDQIYHAVNQGHIPARKSADASGAVLIELRSDYADSLMETQPEVEGALRELFHARLCMAADIAGDTATLAQFKAGRVRVECDLNAGPLSVEEKNEILARYNAGLVSKQSAMVLLGTKDVDAELAQMQEEEREKMGDGFPAPVATATPTVPVVEADDA